MTSDCQGEQIRCARHRGIYRASLGRPFLAEYAENELQRGRC